MMRMEEMSVRLGIFSVCSTFNQSCEPVEGAQRWISVDKGRQASLTIKGQAIGDHNVNPVLADGLNLQAIVQNDPVQTSSA